MTLAEVVGHTRAVDRLRRAADEGRVPGAVLLLGPAGVGKRLLARGFAARLLCEAPVAGDACGVCGHCTRLAAGTHPDLRAVTRDEERRDIRIEQVRDLLRWLVLHPLSAPRKVAIVAEAHLLNEHGQNALLKTLEEPPPSSVLVLTATAPALLLPTVRSRCQVLRLDPLSGADVVRVLGAHGLDAERAAAVAPLAAGAPGRVLALAADEAVAVRRRVLEALGRLEGLDAAQLSQLALEVARGPLEVALAAAVGWYRDLLQQAAGAADLPLHTPEAAAEVRGAAGRLDVPARLRQLEAVCDTLQAIDRNANRQLALETMLLRLRDLERRLPTPSWTSIP
jgi:DNA polymerase III subunit delta'